MFRISLVNMPFSAVEYPSIALSQLQTVARRRFGPEVEVEVVYASLEASRRFGLAAYRRACDEASIDGLGDWVFRQLAFPELPDNTEEFRRRYFPVRDQRREDFEALVRVRPSLGRWLDQLIDEHRLDQADLVGFTSMFGQNVASFALARRLKARNPKVVTTLGGANCESPMGEEIARHVEAIDYVFSGPALVTFPRLIERLMAGDRAGAEAIGGVFTRANCAGASPNVPVFGEELPIDADVPVDYGPFLDTFERSVPAGTVKPSLLFETSRGCWWGERAHCTFCGLNGSSMMYRSMKPELAVELIRSLFAYVPRVSKLNCVDNIMPKEYPRQVFPHLETPPGVVIFYEIKADVTEEEMALLAAAGVTSVQPGIEALATSTLKLMRKGMTSVRNVLFLQHCLIHGIEPAWNLLVGFPGEGEEVYRHYVEILPKLVHLPPPTGVYPVRFDRFSPYFMKAGEYKLDLAPLDFYPLVYPFPPEALAGLAYFFENRDTDARYFLDMVTWLSRLQRALKAWRDAWAGGRAPVLAFEHAGGTTVRDTRSGREAMHDVGDAGRRLLEALAEPTTHPELAKLTFDPPLDLDSELAKLRALDLVFEDGQRLIRLVLPHESAVGRPARHQAVAEALPA
jgi:ribosomal peptide maturation radical SAM protein 1